MNTTSFASENNDTFLWIQSNIPLNTKSVFWIQRHTRLNKTWHSSETSHSSEHNVTFFWPLRHIHPHTAEFSHMFLHRNFIKLQSCRKVILIASAHTRFYEPNRTEPTRTEPNRTESNRTELSWAELNSFGVLKYFLARWNPCVCVVHYDKYEYFLENDEKRKE